MSTPITLPEWDIFLEQLALEPNVSKAARRAGVRAAACYARRERDPDFMGLWDEAMAISKDRIEEAIHRRAIDGIDEPVFYQGAKCGVVRKFSDSLLTTYAKRWIPEYRDRQTVDMNATHTLGPLTDEQRGRLMAEILGPVVARINDPENDLG